MESILCLQNIDFIKTNGDVLATGFWVSPHFSSQTHNCPLIFLKIPQPKLSAWRDKDLSHSLLFFFFFAKMVLKVNSHYYESRIINGLLRIHIRKNKSMYVFLIWPQRVIIWSQLGVSHQLHHGKKWPISLQYFSLKIKIYESLKVFR